MPLNVIVCIKQVPDWEAPADTFKIDSERNKVIPPPNIDPRISLFDEHAIEAALQLREKHGGKVTVVSLGPDFAQRAVKQFDPDWTLRITLLKESSPCPSC